MKARIAQKVLKNSFKGRVYPAATLAKSRKIDERRSSDNIGADHWWHDLMEALGGEGRAFILRDDPAAVAHVVATTPPEHWHGKPEAWNRMMDKIYKAKR